MINSTTGRILVLYISVVRSWHNVGESGWGFKKVGVVGGFSVRNYFPHNLST